VILVNQKILVNLLEGRVSQLVMGISFKSITPKDLLQGYVRRICVDVYLLLKPNQIFLEHSVF